MIEDQSWLTFYHHGLILVAAAVCLFGTWVGMRHFARARATDGLMRLGWLFLASFGTGAALWASTFISILAQAPMLKSGFDLVPTAGALLIALITCLAGFQVGSNKQMALAPEVGGLIVGTGIIVMHYIGIEAWHVQGTISWNWFGIGANIVFGLGLGALSVSRANRPVTRYCRHGAAIVLTFMICVMHYAMFASHMVVNDAAVQLPPNLLPAHMLAVGIVGAVLLVIGSGFSSYLIDLHTRTESSNRIHQLSFNDPMTGLPNRIAFNERLALDVYEAHEKAHKLAAFSIDIDGFKDVNDVFGHAAGDQVLVQVAERLRDTLGDGEFLARQSGDEFLGLQMSGNQPVAAQDFAKRIAGALSEPFSIKGSTVKLTASIGYALFPTDTSERDQLLSNAKLAMYRGKVKLRGLISKYDQTMDEIERKRRALARDLHFAIRGNQLKLHYQLQTSLLDGSVRGAEALMRWHHPERGMISPSEFIPLAEDSDLIIPMGEWALRTACRDAVNGSVPGVVAVNLSPVQLNQTDLVEKVRSILNETGLAPSRLEIEITESTLMKDQATALSILRQFKDLGVAIALDDFGTGYSSLATLHAFPFDKIKLDQSFVRRLPDDTSAMAIVRTVLALGSSLNIPVLAEGIETEAQYAFLANEKCDEGQGYYMARPVPLDGLAAASAGVLARTMRRANGQIIQASAA